MPQKVDPDRKHHKAERHVWDADPCQFGVHDWAQLFGRHGQALLDSRRVEVGEDGLLGDEYADDRADRVHRLREVEPTDCALRLSNRQDAGIGRCLQDRASSGHDEYADEVEVETLPQACRYVEERAAHVNGQSDQDAGAEGELLHEYGREERKHRVCSVERHLHEHGAVLVHREDTLECRHEVVGHVVHDAPEGEAEHQKKDGQSGVFHLVQALSAACARIVVFSERRPPGGIGTGAPSAPPTNAAIRRLAPRRDRASRGRDSRC